VAPSDIFQARKLLLGLSMKMLDSASIEGDWEPGWST